MLQAIRKYWKWFAGGLLVLLTGGLLLKFFNPFSAGKDELEAKKQEGRSDVYEEQAQELGAKADAIRVELAVPAREVAEYVRAQAQAESASAATRASTATAVAEAGVDVDKLAKLLD